MSTVYGENGLTGTGYTPPKRVNFGWLGESWGLFRENAGLWIFAILIGAYAPLIFNAFVFGAWHLTTHGAHDFVHISRGLETGVSLLTLAYVTFIWSGIFRMAVKQVSGEPIAFSDVFSGASNFPSMLAFLIVSYLLIVVGSFMVIIPGILAAGLLLPGFAMVASGEPVGSAIQKSFAAMWPERLMAMAFAFGLGLIVWLSSLVFALGPLVTLSMYAIVSALAYRDMIGLPHSGKVESLDTILGLAPEAPHAVSLTGEVDDDIQK